jgi:hypothetical protein
MVLSAVTAVVAIWQARVLADHLSAAVWPYGRHGRGAAPWTPFFEISLVNAGVAPAIMRRFSVRVDGAPVRSWREFLAAISEDEAVRSAAFGEGVVQGVGWVMTPNSPVSGRIRVPAAGRVHVRPHRPCAARAVDRAERCLEG